MSLRAENSWLATATDAGLEIRWIAAGRAVQLSSPGELDSRLSAEHRQLAALLATLLQDEPEVDGSPLLIDRRDGSVVITADGIYLGDLSRDSGGDELREAMQAVFSLLGDVVDVPPTQAVRVELSAAGTFASSDFTIHSRLYVPPRRPFLGEIVGPFLRYAEGWVSMLPESVYRLLAGLDESWGASEAERMLRWGIVRPLAERAGAHMDSYLEREHVVRADRVRPTVTDAGHGRVALGAAIDDESSGEFSEKFERFGRVQDKYNLEARGAGERVRVVPSAAAAEALEELKQKRILEGDDVPRFMANPEAYLEGEGFDLSDFADRVIGLDVYVYRAVSFLETPNKKREWFEWDGEGDSPAFTVTLQSADGEGKPLELNLADDGVRQKLERQLSEAAASGAQFVEVSEGRHVPTDELNKALKSFRELKATKTPEKRQQLILKILENVDQVEYDEVAMAPPLAGGFESIESPAGLASQYELMNHQQEGYEWMYSLAKGKAAPLRGGLLADDMGLGKTIQLLAVLARLVQEHDSGPILVVAPVSLLENWAAEVEKFFPGVFPNILYAPGHPRRPKRSSDTTRRVASERAFAELLEQADIVTTSYETLRAYQLAFARVSWRCVVLDEAQKVKNVRTRASMAVKSLKMKSRFALTGTPVENSFAELWNIVDFLNPGFLGALKDFSREYVHGWGRAEEAERLAIAGRLTERIAPVFLRRVKEEVLSDLPEKTPVRHEVSLGPEQKLLYGREVEAYRAGSGIHHFALLPRLFKICAHPGLMAEEYLSATCPKLRKTMEILRAIREAGEKVVVFAGLHALQAVLQGEMKSEFGFLPSVINGATPSRRRKHMIDEFSDVTGFNVIILGPRAAGLGLNITAANHVIHYTREWNPAVETQCTDRVYRIGQTRPVQVHYPIVCEEGFSTVEQRLDELLGEKHDMARAVIRPTADLVASFDDFAECLAGPPDKPSASLGIEDTDHLDWRQFEALVAALKASEGLTTELTAERDSGADVVCRSDGDGKNALIQVKHRRPEAGAVGPDGVQQIVGARAYYENLLGARFPELLVVSNGTFSAQSRSLAKANRVNLVDRGALDRMLRRHQPRMTDVARFL